MAILTDDDIAQFDSQSKQPKILTDDDISAFDQTPKKTFGDTVKDSITRIPGVYYESGKKMVGSVAHVLANPVETVKGVAHAVTHPIDTAKAFVKDRYDTPENTMKTLANDPFGVISDASLATGGSGMVLKAAGKANKMAGVAKVGEALTDTSIVPLQAAGKMVNPVVKGVADAIKGTPETMRNVSGRMHNMVAKLPTKAYNFGKDPLAVMQKEAITANTTTEYAELAEQRLSQRVNELNEAVAKSNKTVQLGDAVGRHIQKAFTETSNSLKKSVRETVSAKVEDMGSSILREYGDLDNLSIQEAVRLKRQLADDFPFSGNVEDDIVAKAAHKIHHDINKAIETAVPEVAELNDRVSSLIDISKAAKNRVAVEARNNPISLIGTLLGAAGGGTVGGGKGAALGVSIALGAKAMSSPAVLTRVANTLSYLSDVDKLNLFKAVPWFKKVAQKAEAEYGGTAELRPYPRSAQALSYSKPIRRTDRMLPTPKAVGQSSGPIIRHGGDYPQSPSGLPFYTMDEYGRVKGSGFLMGEKKLRPQDVNDELVMAEKPLGTVGSPEIISAEDELANLQIRADMAKEEYKLLQQVRRDLRGSINPQEFSKGEFQDLKKKLNWVASPKGVTLDQKATEFFEQHPEFYPKNFKGHPGDALAFVLKDLVENRGTQYINELRGVIKSANKKLKGKS